MRTSLYVTGHVSPDGTRLLDTSGWPIGHLEQTRQWRQQAPNQRKPMTLRQYRAVVRGLIYTGRASGPGGFYRGKRLASDLRDKG